MNCVMDQVPVLVIMKGSFIIRDGNMEMEMFMMT